MSKKEKVKIKIKMTAEELVKVFKDLDLCCVTKQPEPSEGDKWVTTQLCRHADTNDIKRLNERYAQTDCEAHEQFGHEAEDIVIKQMEEAMDRGADPFPMMNDEGIKTLKDVTNDLLKRVIPVQDLIQVRDVADDINKAFKHSDTEIICCEYKKACYVPEELQKVAMHELRPFEHKFERSLFLVDFLLSHFYPDDKHIKIKLADGYTPQVFVIGEYDESNEGYSAELRVRDKNEEGEYEAIRGFVKPDKAINFKLFC